MKRTWVAAAFALLTSIALFTAGSEAQPGSLKEIVPGVWFREGEIKELGHCNNVIIEMKDYLIVVDANFPSGARATLADAKKVSKKPVKYVFDTHHHGDHAYGNAFWTRQGATTLAHKGVVEELGRYEPKRWRDAAKERKDVAELKLDTAEPPKQTFDKSPFVLDDGSRRLELHFFGWAHTRGDGFAYLPKEQVLCTGDAVVNGPYNYRGDGNIKNWPNVVSAAQKLKVKHVLPGHGGPGGPEILAGQKLFLIELQKAVRAAIAKKQKLEDLVTMQGGKPVSSSLPLPDSVANWKGNPYPAQVEAAYLEAASGIPAGERGGGK